MQDKGRVLPTLNIPSRVGRIQGGPTRVEARLRHRFCLHPAASAGELPLYLAASVRDMGRIPQPPPGSCPCIWQPLAG